MTNTKYCNKEIRNFLRKNPHFTDSMVAEEFNVSNRVVSANKAHITMGTDTDNPQKRAKPKQILRTFKKQLTLIRTNVYQVVIDEDGQYYRCEVKNKKIRKLTDEQAKAIMLNRLHETYNV